MPEFRVCEVQVVTRMRKWWHRVDAETAKEAIQKVREGEADLVSDGDDIGEEDYGESGYAVVVDGDEDAAEDEALEDYART